MQGKPDLRREVVLSKPISKRLSLSGKSALVRLIEGNLLVVHSPTSYRFAYEKGSKVVTEEIPSRSTQAIYFCDLESNKVEWAANYMSYFIAKRQGEDPETGKKRQEVLFFNGDGI